MRRLFWLSSFLLLSACTVKTPQVHVTEFHDINPKPFGLDLHMACAKSEKDVTISAEALQKRVVIHGQVQMQDTDITDCEGKVTRSQLQVTSFKQTLNVTAPEAVAKTASRVRAVNARSCLPAEAQVDGNHFAIHLREGLFQLGSELIVRDGKNPVQLTYLDAAGKELAKEDMVVDIQITRVPVAGVGTLNACTSSQKK